MVENINKIIKDQKALKLAHNSLSHYYRVTLLMTGDTVTQ